MHINVRDLTNWKSLAGGFLGMPNLSSFAVAFDSTKREEAEAALMAEAIADARKRAQMIAAGFGRKLGAVAAVSPAGLRNLGSAMGLVNADFRYSRETRAQQVYKNNILQIVPLKLAQPVDVIFRIKQ